MPIIRTPDSCFADLPDDPFALYDRGIGGSAPLRMHDLDEGLRDGAPVLLHGEPACRAALGQWRRPFLCLLGRHDPVLGHADQALIRHLPGARGQPHQRLARGHFIQEDRGPAPAAAIRDLIRRCP